MDRCRGGQGRSRQGPDALGAPAPVQHRAEGDADRRALHRQRAAAALGPRPRHGGDGQPPGSGALQARDGQVHCRAGLRHRHAGGVFRRGERRSQRGRDGEREIGQPEPATEGAGHPRSVCRRRPAPADRGQQVPDRVRPAAAVRHVRGQAPRGHPGGADAQPPEPRLRWPVRQEGHDLRAGLRERPGRGAGGVSRVLRNRRTGRRDRPCADPGPEGQAGRLGPLRRIRG